LGTNVPVVIIYKGGIKKSGPKIKVARKEITMT
jgi:hypothetical protein